MKKTVIGLCVAVVILVGLVIGYRFTLVDAMETLETTLEKLEATESMLLDEANRSQKLQESLQEYKMQYNQLRQQLSQRDSRSIIVGRVYADANYNRAVDGTDHLVSDDNVKAVLYSVKRGSDGAFNHTRVASTTVVNGQYLFNVKPGEYFVGLEYNDYQTYIRRYNLIIHISGSNMVIGAGETVPGPTILLTINKELG